MCTWVHYRFVVGVGASVDTPFSKHTPWSASDGDYMWILAGESALRLQHEGMSLGLVATMRFKYPIVITPVDIFSKGNTYG